ncbi:MAG: ABC transporter permease [Deltaproteobacteria bacterium]|nr:ABC transporter permease [Deltaproteobacteria bacterium]
MNNIILRIAWLSFNEGIRQRTIYGVSAFGLIMAAAAYTFIPFIGFDVCRVVIDFMLMAVSAGCLMIIFFLCLPGLIGDIRDQTVYFVLSCPVSREEYILGRFFGFTMILFIALVILDVPALLMVKLYMMKYPGYVPLHFEWHKLLLASFFRFYAALVFLSFVFLVWSIMESGVLVSIAAIIAYLIGQNINTVKNIAMASKTMGIAAKKLIVFASWIFPNLGYFNLNTYAVYGVKLPEYYMVKLLVYGLSYMSIAIVITMFLFKRRDL